LLAAELGVDLAIARRAGLLHDIGKAVNHEFEGPHAIVGADLIKRYGESDVVVNGVASITTTCRRWTAGDPGERGRCISAPARSAF